MQHPPPNPHTPDSGTTLRGLYAPEGGVTHIFSNKVADYARSRPDYPAAMFDALHEHCTLRAGAVVVDVGAGTGLLTRGLLARGYAVTAVEPNAAMRAHCDQQLGHAHAYASADGSAEAIPLPDAAADLITAAQAFHWFDIDKARAEFLRVLRPLGQVALVWNDRVLGDPLHVALDEVFAQYGGAKRGALLAHEERAAVPRFFGDGNYQELHWPHAHQLDAAGLLSLVFSRSYMPQRQSDAGQEACAQLNKLFARLSVNGQVAVRYTTVAILGRPG